MNVGGVFWHFVIKIEEFVECREQITNSFNFVNTLTEMNVLDLVLNIHRWLDCAILEWVGRRRLNIESARRMWYSCDITYVMGTMNFPKWTISRPPIWCNYLALNLGLFSHVTAAICYQYLTLWTVFVGFCLFLVYLGVRWEGGLCCILPNVIPVTCHGNHHGIKTASTVIWLLFFPPVTLVW